MTTTYEAAMPQLLRGGQLDRASARALMAELVRGDLGAARVAAVLTALAARPVGAEELIGFASVLRERARRVQVSGDTLDTCGTGGSGLSTANTSTMAAFVLAAAGVAVTKHGNRKSSGRCGSVDVLEALGIRVEVGPEQAPALLAGHSLALLFAPLYHPAVGMVMPVRRELGFRTVFNLLGPLANPAGASHQLLGVSDADAAPHMAAALAGLGVRRAMVVRGDDGLDELSLAAPSTIWHVEAGQDVRIERIDLVSLGLTPVQPDALLGGDPAFNAALLQAVLRGDERGAHAEHVALNAGAGLVLMGRAATLAEGVAQARTLLHDGAGWRALERYRDASQDLEAA